MLALNLTPGAAQRRRSALAALNSHIQFDNRLFRDLESNQTKRTCSDGNDSCSRHHISPPTELRPTETIVHSSAQSRSAGN